MNKRQYSFIFGALICVTSAFAEVTPETVVDIFNRLEALENKTRQLYGENEVLKHQIEQLKKVQKKGFLNIDEQIEEIKNRKPAAAPQVKKEEASPAVKVIESKPAAAVPEKKPEPVATTPKPVPAAPQAPVAPKAPATNTAKKKIRAPSSYEKETYQAAFSLMKKSPTAASRAFQEYIKMQPESPLAANSQYWIGEIMYSHNNYKGAVQEFIKVLQKYKYSDKAPDAAIKLGYSFYALKNWAYAKRTFEDVKKYFPENKNAVALAEKRLAKIKAEGH